MLRFDSPLALAMHLHAAAMAARRRRKQSVTSFWILSLVILGMLLVLGAGCCLFDADAGHDGHDETRADLCLGMIVASLIVPLLVGPRLTGWVPSEGRRLVYATAPHLPDPPPKRHSSF
jgi:hypothetical protein